MNLFDDIEKFMKVPDEWAPPETKPYAPGVIFIFRELLLGFQSFR